MSDGRRRARLKLALAGALTRWPRALFVLERHPLNVRLAIRGTAGMMVPLLLGQALAWTSLNTVAFSAFLLAFGDVGPEDRRWLRRLVAASVFAAVAGAMGVLVGGHLVWAAIGMFVCGGAIGLAGVYGDGAAGMSLPVAWIFLEVGLTASHHTPVAAGHLGLLVLAGGAWAIALAWAAKAIGPDRPLAAATGLCFATLADYLDRPLAADPAPPGLVPPLTGRYSRSPETRVRATIAEARSLAVEIRRRQTSTSPAGQRLIVLIELADQIFTDSALLAVTPHAEEDAAAARERTVGDESSSSDRRAIFVTASRAVARALAGHGDRAAVSRIEETLRRLAAISRPAEAREVAADSPRTAHDADGAAIHARVAGAFAHALHLVRGHSDEGEEIERLARLSEPAPSASALGGGSRSLRVLLRPVRDALSPRSVVGRHALRYALITSAAVAIDVWRDAPFGYWIPLTVTVVLKPYAGSTFTRAGQRVGGTVAGVVVGALLTQVLTTTLGRVAAVSAAFFASLAVMPLNYGLVVFFLSAGVVPFEAILYQTGDQIGMLRAVNTCIGGALALAGGYFLWPSFERRSLPTLLSAAFSSMALYADSVLAAVGQPSASRASIEPAHRRAGLDNTNLQISFERIADEPGGSEDRFEAILLAVTTLQRLLLNLNVLRGLGPDVAAEGASWTRLRELVSAGLADLPAALASGVTPAPLPDLEGEARVLSRRLMTRGARYDGLLARAVERLAWQVNALRTAVGRISRGERLSPPRDRWCRPSRDARGDRSARAGRCGRRDRP